MKRLLKLGIVFLIPFLLYILFIVAVDPYEFVHKSNDPLKRKICLEEDYGRLTYSIDYMRNPKPNIIFGASQPNKIDIDNIPEDGWCKMSFGGATMQEYIKAFWLTTQYNKLEKVIFMLDSYGYSMSINGRSSRYDQAYKIVTSSPQLYFVNKNVLNASISYIFQKVGFSKKKKKQLPEKSVLWQSQLELALSVFQLHPDYADYSDLSNSMCEIKSYCDKKNIQVLLCTPIIHSDLYNTTIQTAPDVYEGFISDMVEIFGDVMDFGFPNEYTNDSIHFGDPFHVSSDSVYIQSIWGEDKAYYYRVIDKDNLNEVIMRK